MSTRMLIDARHKEETRVTVIRGNRVEEFDYESTHKAQIKGNIYLAKVTRVEPSLQAAFVEYGGNRHGFLAFSEIHPDYYQIPIADREALLAEERAANARDAEDEEKEEEVAKGKGKKKSAKKEKDAGDAGDAGDNTGDNETPDENAGAIPDAENDALGVQAPEAKKTAASAEANTANTNAGNNDDADDNENGGGEDNGEPNNDGDDANGGEDEMEETIRKRRSMRSLKRRYKIQEVIKRRQILLVQVVKEERGTKGAALTTYLSLAGRYCVLMPNSTHGGGVSRKISNAADRRKLKTILGALEGPQGIGCIIRTAGLQRTKAEIKRDYDYLLKLWESIRDLTLKSVAPALIYEEGNLIKRSIRDLYDRSIDEVLVEGEEAYKAAKALMKLLMPSHAKRVQHYQEKIPLFHRYQVEEQLDSMFNPVVTLRSGGYLVINPTEALISIDVNSGRSTREHNIEETALKTNLEASDEIGRQLRLRDMAGLIVIDYIDMEYRGNNRKIERRLKDALKADRARIQVGRISQFGLMEMSRQRLRPNLVEASTVTCSHCEGTGRARTVASSALHVLRALEEEGIRERSAKLSLSVPGEVASYILNAKRDDLHEMEQKYGLQISVLSDNKLVAPHYELTRSGTAPDGAEVSEVLTDKPDTSGKPSRRNDTDQDAFSGKGNRRRRRHGREDKPESVAATTATENTAPQTAGESETRQEGDEDKPRKRRRRGRRGGRRRRAAIAAGAETGGAEASATPIEAAETGSGAAAAPPETPDSDSEKAAAQPADDSAQPAGDSTQLADDSAKTGGEKAAEKKPARRRGRTAAAKPDAHSAADEAAAGSEKEEAAPTTAEASAATTEAKPARSRKSPAKKAGAKKADKAEADSGKAEGKSGDTAAKAPARKTRAKSSGKKTQEAKTEEKTEEKTERKTESKAEKPAKGTSGSGANAKAGNGSTPEAATKADAKKADNEKSAPAAEAKKEKTKRGWWQRSS